jgi:spermidine synthase
LFRNLGSGKGRVLLEALRYPFARVIEVEISKELHEAAVERGPRRCRRIELIHADAVEYRSRTTFRSRTCPTPSPARFSDK